jgi:hypothetical protein
MVGGTSVKILVMLRRLLKLQGLKLGRQGLLVPSTAVETSRRGRGHLRTWGRGAPLPSPLSRRPGDVCMWWLGQPGSRWAGWTARERLCWGHDRAQGRSRRRWDWSGHWSPPSPPLPLKLLLVPPPFFLPPRLPRLEKPPGGALEVPCGVWCGGWGGVAGGREASEGPLPPLVPQ